MLAQVLKPWDTIGIVSPSYPVTEQKKHYLHLAAEKFATLWLHVVYSEHCFATDEYGASAWTPQQRADDINNFFADPTINAMYCSQWWSTAIEIVSLIDYENIKRHPKVFLGMSDIDLLHCAIYTKTWLVTFHWSDPRSWRGIDLDIPYTWEQFQARMFQKSHQIPAASLRATIRPWTARGTLLWCNLSTLLKLAWTQYWPTFENTVLCLEWYSVNIKTTLYQLQQLKEIGVFEQITWLVIGYIYWFQDPYRRKENAITHEFEEIVVAKTREYSFPILKTDDFGHHSPNCFLPIGSQVFLDATNQHIEITSDFLL